QSSEPPFSPRARPISLPSLAPPHHRLPWMAPAAFREPSRPSGRGPPDPSRPAPPGPGWSGLS
uniref:Uncharacterized protein n=1 Tax=Aegilops tauschii subsp. strangulata TaxID=200361 RepID=A0A452ZPM1_AEGTS